MTDELPEGWTSERLGKMADLVLGKMLDKGKRGGGTPRRYLRNINVQWDRIDTTDAYSMPFADHERERFGLRSGDLLVCEGGEPGRCAVWDGREADMRFQKALHRVRPSNALDVHYLRHHLRWDAQRGVLEDMFTGSTIKHFTGRALAEYEVRVAPLAEQKRIVEKVEALLADVNQARARLAKVVVILKRFRQAVLAAACSGKLTEDWRATHATGARPRVQRIDPTNDLSDHDAHLDGIDLPASWARHRVDALVEIQNGRAFPSKEYEKAQGVRLLRPGNLDGSGRVGWTDDNTVRLPVKWANEFPDFVLGKGELLMNLTAQSLKDEFLGRACIKDDPEPAMLNQRIARFVSVGKTDLRPYLLLYFKSSLFRSFVSGLDQGGSDPERIEFETSDRA